ncbi:MAG: LysR family transcriptional regulator [Verrucomicrobiota bacterium]
MNSVRADDGEANSKKEQDLESIDFRHLQAFHVVYEEKDFTAAGHRLSSNRKCVMRLMQSLEKAFGGRLFDEASNGGLVACDFATRLFNDLRQLEMTREKLRGHVNRIHEKGRLLRVGCSAAMFRTCGFRNLFRALQSVDGIRPGYVPVDFQHAGKAMMSGHCDLFVGPWAGPSSRFVTCKVGRVAYRLYQGSATGVAPLEMAARPLVVPLDGCLPVVPDAVGQAETIDVSQWLFWLDHPEDFPAGLKLLGPEVRLEPEVWSVEPMLIDALPSVEVNVSYLHHHAYEFLPSLVSSLHLSAPR